MHGLDVLERFERTASTWICVESVTFHFPDGRMEFEPGSTIGRDTWLGRQLDQLAALSR